ncbi:MAG: S41 family peptidase [Pseudomonadota bacterium]
MRPFFAICTALFVAVPSLPAAAQAQPAPAGSLAAEERMSVEQVRRDIALAEEAYSRIHPGYTRYASAEEMKQAWASVVAQAEAQGGMTLPEFYLATELVLTRIRCDHTKAELPRSLRKARKGQPLYLPFRWDLIEGRGIIEAAAPETGLSRGDEILAIDGRSLEETVSAVKKYIPFDGYTEWARTGGVAQSLEFMGGAVDHFGMLLWNTPAVATLTIRGSDGNTREVAADRITFADWTTLGDTSGRARNFKDAVTFERIGENTGYLRVDTFVNYRQPVDPATLFDPIFDAMEDEQRDTLILDLRSNGGGSSDAAFGLVSYLLPEAMQLKTSMTVATLDITDLKEHLSTWEPRALNPDPRGFIANADGTYTLREGISEETGIVTPADSAFQGRLIVLSSTNNGSGSTNMMAILEQQERTVLVGEKTGGSAEGPNAGILFTLTLPESGLRARIPVFRYTNNVVDFEEGMGLTPDIAASMTVDAFRAGRDPVLEKAKSLALEGVATRASQVEVGEAVESSGVLTASITDFAMLEGDQWSGQLEYLNYGRDDRSTIPVRMVARAPAGRSMPYDFIYPGEEDKNAKDRMRVSRDGTKINQMAITKRFVDQSGALVLVTDAKGRDDNRPADIRVTYTIAPTSFVVAKDVRFEGGEFFNRNEYRLTR